MKTLILACILLIPITTQAKCNIHRSSAVRYQFKVLTGYPDGRPGYVIDHIQPLCAGGLDTTQNMQWMTIADAKIKDRWERSICHCK